uniref:Retrovirus-related Pol polyprotein from transposon TNT 1-94 n=1 Tax=Rhabditophanes sp. KR3021 TaxID=114890 RepID=A0AC35TLC3_9BILA
METESTWEETVRLCQVDNPENEHIAALVKLTSAIINNAKTNDQLRVDIYFNDIKETVRFIKKMGQSGLLMDALVKLYTAKSDYYVKNASKLHNRLTNGGEEVSDEVVTAKKEQDKKKREAMKAKKDAAIWNANKEGAYSAYIKERTAFKSGRKSNMIGKLSCMVCNDYSIDDICNELCGSNDKGDVSGEMDVEEHTSKGKEKVSKLVNSNFDDDFYIAATNEYDEGKISGLLSLNAKYDKCGKSIKIHSDVEFEYKNVEQTFGGEYLKDVGYVLNEVTHPDPSRELYRVKPCMPAAFKDTTSLREISYEKYKSYGYQPENVAKYEFVGLIRMLSVCRDGMDKALGLPIGFIDRMKKTITTKHCKVETYLEIRNEILEMDTCGIILPPLSQEDIDAAFESILRPLGKVNKINHSFAKSLDIYEQMQLGSFWSFTNTDGDSINFFRGPETYKPVYKDHVPSNQIDFAKTVALDQSSNDSFFTADISFVHDGDTAHTTSTPYKANPEDTEIGQEKSRFGKRKHLLDITRDNINGTLKRSRALLFDPAVNPENEPLVEEDENDGGRDTVFSDIMPFSNESASRDQNHWDYIKEPAKAKLSRNQSNKSAVSITSNGKVTKKRKTPTRVDKTPSTSQKQTLHGTRSSARLATKALHNPNMTTINEEGEESESGCLTPRKIARTQETPRLDHIYKDRRGRQRSASVITMSEKENVDHAAVQSEHNLQDTIDFLSEESNKSDEEGEQTLSNADLVEPGQCHTPEKLMNKCEEEEVVATDILEREDMAAQEVVGKDELMAFQNGAIASQLAGFAEEFEDDTGLEEPKFTSTQVGCDCFEDENLGDKSFYSTIEGDEELVMEQLPEDLDSSLHTEDPIKVSTETNSALELDIDHAQLRQLGNISVLDCGLFDDILEEYSFHEDIVKNEVQWVSAASKFGELYSMEELQMPISDMANSTKIAKNVVSASEFTSYGCQAKGESVDGGKVDFQTYTYKTNSPAVKKAIYTILGMEEFDDVKFNIYWKVVMEYKRFDKKKSEFSEEEVKIYETYKKYYDKAKKFILHYKTNFKQIMKAPSPLTLEIKGNHTLRSIYYLLKRILPPQMADHLHIFTFTNLFLHMNNQYQMYYEPVVYAPGEKQYLNFHVRQGNDAISF